MDEAPASVPIRIGTAGWSYEDWKGIVYPLRPPPRFDPLELMASLFDVNEINSTFYRIPTARTTREWARRVAHNARFAFTAKLFRGFTHERTAGSREEKEFQDAMAPLAEEGRLASLLIQFPVSFRNTAENRDALDSLLRRFESLALATEFRHGSWDADDARAVLAAHGAFFVNIDQPWIGENLRATDDVAPGRAYYRFHGRNAAKWFGPDTSNEERYDFLYSEEQLHKFAGRLARSASQAGRPFDAGPLPAGASGVTAILNNHFRGQAVANAIELQHLLTGEVVTVPASLSETYPSLARSTQPAPPEREPSQGSLFAGPRSGKGS